MIVPSLALVSTNTHIQTAAWLPKIYQNLVDDFMEIEARRRLLQITSCGIYWLPLMKTIGLTTNSNLCTMIPTLEVMKMMKTQLKSGYMVILLIDRALSKSQSQLVSSMALNVPISLLPSLSFSTCQSSRSEQMGFILQWFKF